MMFDRGVILLQLGMCALAALAAWRSPRIARCVLAALVLCAWVAEGLRPGNDPRVHLDDVVFFVTVALVMHGLHWLWRHARRRKLARDPPEK